MVANFPDLLPEYQDLDASLRLIACLTTGGDARITLDRETGLNRYLAAPYPRRSLAFASSTANDMSQAAFDYLLARAGDPERPYAVELQSLRNRIRSAYGVADDVEVVFAPSGTDLEYVALAAVAGRENGGIHNILLGADEVGSGCIHSASGCYFANETALGIETVPGGPVPGMGPVTLVDIPVRCDMGEVRSSVEIAAAIRSEICRARDAGRHALVHIVHGSKTGLIRPKLEQVDDLQAEFGSDVTFVVDACQARITGAAIGDYLQRGAIVFLTGSKFMGGPPFSGFALIPAALASAANPLPEGYAAIFRRAEWGQAWAGREQLEDSANPGLVLRLQAAIFELERFCSLDFREVRRVILTFQRAVDALLVRRMGFAPVQPFRAGNEGEACERPLEMLSLVTLDVTAHPQARTFDQAQTLYRSLDRAGLRLGQPVRSVRNGAGEWGGTLRIGLSMPQVVSLSALGDHELERVIFSQLSRFADALAVPA